MLKVDERPFPSLCIFSKDSIQLFDEVMEFFKVQILVVLEDGCTKTSGPMLRQLLVIV